MKHVSNFIGAVSLTAGIVLLAGCCEYKTCAEAHQAIEAMCKSYGPQFGLEVWACSDISGCAQPAYSCGIVGAGFDIPCIEDINGDGC